MPTLTRRRLVLRQSAVVDFPSDISGLVAWYKADALALNDGDAVSSWADSSGSSHPVVQATGANQPLFKAGTINGLPVVSFDGSNDSLKVTFTHNQPTTRLFVARLRSLGSGTTKDMCDGGNADSGVLQKTAGGLFQMYAGSFVVDGAVDTAWHIFALLLNNASSNVRVDGGPGVSGTANVLNPGGVTLGSHAGGTLNCDVDFAEFLSYSGALSANDIDRLGRYLAAKYALTWNGA